MAEPDSEKKKSTSSSSSVSLDCSLLADSVSKLNLSPSPSTKKEHIPDWSLLPEELLQLISTHLCCFVDAIHARSVCCSWRSTFAFPSCLLRPSYSLPSFPRKSNDYCTLEKIPLFLYRVKTQTLPSEYFLGGIARDREEDHHHTEELSSPVQCSVKVNLPGGSDPTVMNMLDCQILPLGHRYRIIGKDPEESGLVRYAGVAFLPLNKEGRGGEGGGGFVVILNYTRYLMVLRSSHMRWIRFKRLSNASCDDIFTFKGLFFANFLNGETFVINPYSLEAVRFMPRENSSKYLVPSGDNEELFLVQRTIPIIDDVLSFPRAMCRVSKLDKKTCKWTVVSDLGDRVLFLGELGNVGCSGKELPDGCGLSGNSILFTDWPGEETHVYKYGVETGNPEDDLGFWRFSREYRVLLRNRSPPVVAFRVEQ